MNRTRAWTRSVQTRGYRPEAAAVPPSVIGGPGSDFICQPVVWRNLAWNTTAMVFSANAALAPSCNIIDPYRAGEKGGKCSRNDINATFPGSLGGGGFAQPIALHAQPIPLISGQLAF